MKVQYVGVPEYYLIVDLYMAPITEWYINWY